MIRDAAFGQYYPGDSFAHKMDPRSKLMITVLFIATVFFSNSFAAFGCCAAFLLICIFNSDIPFRSVLRSVKPILLLIVISTILNLLFYRQGKVLLDLRIIKITDGGIRFTLIMIMRLVMLVMGSALLTLTTTPVALTDGIESLLKPLNLVRFPVHELALIMSIALRFIPTLMNETDRIISAQKARGADFESGNLLSRAKALLPILIPLLISAFRRADELSDAMDSRCYRGAKGRTKMKRLKFHGRDFVALSLCLMTLAFAIIDKFVLFLPLI